MNPRIPLILFPSMSRIARLGLAIALFWILEWTFHYTSLSWLHFSGFTQASFIGIKALWIGMVLGCLAQTIIELLLLAGSAIFPRLAKWAGYLAYGPEAGVLAITTIMFIDNISYTFFKVGLTTLPTEAVPWYRIAAGITLLGIWCYAAYTDSLSSQAAKKIRVGSCGVLLAVGAILCLYPWVEEPAPDTGLPLDTVAKTRPNILLISIDGVESEFMSAYGYEKDTTPFLKSLASKMTVFTNHYTNNCCTIGSLVSMWTGQTPLEHGVVYVPATLSPIRATKHLPGMLKQLGYNTHQVGDEFFANSFRVGLRKAFDTVNFRPVAGTFNGANPYRLYPFTISESETSFIAEAQQRAMSRVKSIKDPLIEFLTSSATPDASRQIPIAPAQKASRDSDNVNNLRDLLTKEKTPWFAHLHLMGTHRPWIPTVNTFEEQSTEKDPESLGKYLGTLLDADKDIAALLEERDLFDESIVILTSDHTRHRKTNVPIPFMLHIPHQSTNEKVNILTQSTDIAPTVLGALGIKPPAWMSGQDLNHKDKHGSIVLSVSEAHETCDRSGCYLAPGWEKAPYGIRSITANDCDKFLTIELTKSERIVTFKTIKEEPSQKNPVSQCSDLVGKPDIASSLKSTLYLLTSPAPAI